MHLYWRSFQTLVWIMIAFTTIPQNSSGFNYCDSASSNAKMVQEDHYYYRSCYLVDKELADELWVPIDFKEKVTAEHVHNHAFRRSGNLTFDFPFYGSLVRTITLLPEGFITLGEDEMYVGLSPVRYIAPLMLLNFQSSPDSYMGYYETDVIFTIQWMNLGAEPLINIGNFSFQATLHKNGSIVFVYKTIPPYQMWKSYLFSTRAQIGTSDAYQHHFDSNSPPLTTQFHKTDLANFDLYPLESSAIVFLDPLPTCDSFKDCESCSQADIKPEGCVWCAKMEKCTNSIQVYSSLEMIRDCSDIFDDKINCTSAATGQLNDAGAKIVPESGPKTAVDPHSAYGSSVVLILSPYFDWLWLLLYIFLAFDIICGVIYWNRVRAEIQSLIAWIKKCTQRSTNDDLERHQILQESDQNASSNTDVFLKAINMRSLLAKKVDEVFTL